MSRHRLRQIFPIAFFVLSFPATAQARAADWLSFLAPAAQAELFVKGFLENSGKGPDSLAYWRAAPFSAELLAALGDRSSTLAAEGWYLLDRPAAQDSEELERRVFAAVTAFTTMKGLKAKSPFFEAMEDFMLDSYRVDSATGRLRLPDPIEPKPPKTAEYVLYGKEALVGDVYYQLKYKAATAWSTVTLENLVPMKTLFLNLVQKGELLTVFHIVPVSDRLLLHTMAIAKMPFLPGIVSIERASLVNRMRALSLWLQGNLSASPR